MEQEELKKAVLRAAGIGRLRPRHCAVISGLIYERTGRQISISTLKRVYGFITQPVKTSRYTISALEEFCRAGSLKKAG